MPGPAPESKTREQIEQELANYLAEYQKALEKKYEETLGQVSVLEERRKKIEEKRKLVENEWWAGSGTKEYASSVNIIDLGVTGASFSVTGASVGVTGLEMQFGMWKTGLWGCYESPNGITIHTAATKAHADLLANVEGLVKDVNELNENVGELLANENDAQRVAVP